MYICHFGTNNLRSPKSADQIAREIVNIGLEIKTDQNEVVISSITHRNDKLNAKGSDVNKLLKSLCNDYSLGFIDNGNIRRNHLNSSGLHLNMQGTAALANNFLDYIDA